MREARARRTAEGFGVLHAFDGSNLVSADLGLVGTTTPPVLHRAMAAGALDEGRPVHREMPDAGDLRRRRPRLPAAVSRSARAIQD